MIKYIITALLLICPTLVFGASRQQLDDGTGNIIGTSSNPIHVNCVSGCNGGGGGGSATPGGSQGAIQFYDVQGTVTAFGGNNGFVYTGAGSTSGNIGIGSISPGQNLDVQGTVRALFYLGNGSLLSGISTSTGANPTATVGTSAVNGSATTFLRSDGAPAINLTMSPTWTGNHIFAPSSGDTKFTAGNVAVGTTSAVSALTVSGLTTLQSTSDPVGNRLLNTSLTGASGSTAPTSWTGVFLGTGSFTSSGGTSLIIADGTNDAYIAQSITTVVGSTYIASYTCVVTDAFAGCQLKIGNSDNNSALGSATTGLGGVGLLSVTFVATSTTTHMTIYNGSSQVTQNATVTTPSFVLLKGVAQVLNDAGSGSIGYGNSPTPPAGGLIVQSNVGIGSVTPGQMLDVQGTARILGFQMNVGSSLNGKVLTSDASGNGTWGAAGGGSQTPWTSDINGAGFKLISTGNIGVGSATPGQALDVQGTVRAIAFIKSSGTSSQFLKADGSTDSSSYLTGNQTITASGDATGSGTTTLALTLKNTGTAGTYRSTTFDAQGRETAGTNPTTFSGYAISDTSANLAAALTDETGTGVAVFNNGPTFIAPILGTPSSGVATNLTGTAASLTAGTVTTNANLTGPITSSGNATAIGAQTGTGSTFVMQASPTLTTPVIGAATGTSLTTSGNIGIGTTFINGAGEAALTVMNGNVGIGTWTPAAGLDVGTPLSIRGRPLKRVLLLSAGSATPAVNSDLYDVVHITAQSAAITSFTMTGTPVQGDTLRIDITDDGTARAIAWGTSFESSTQILPTTTVISTRLDVGFIWNTVTSKWRCVAAS